MIKFLRCYPEYLAILLVFLYGCTKSNSLVVEPLGIGNSGIKGEVSIGPVTPVCTADQPCTVPYQATILIYKSTGTFVQSVQSDTLGNFTVALLPGTYRLVPVMPNPNNFPIADQQIVTVVKDEYTRVEIFYDTGIR